MAILGFRQTRLIARDCGLVAIRLKGFSIVPLSLPVSQRAGIIPYIKEQENCSNLFALAKGAGEVVSLSRPGLQGCSLLLCD
jgi:hypothetical protein